MGSDVETSPSPIELRLAAVPESIAVARHELAAYARRVGADAFAVKTCVSEAVTNAVIHGYPEAPGEVEVRGLPDHRHLVVTVTDVGGGIRPNSNRGGLGLGLPIIGKLADELRVISDEGTTIEMRFGL